MKTLSRRSGFSLVELLTVIAIIAILAAIIFPVMSLVKEKARRNQCISNIKQISMALGLFKTDKHCYPVTLVPAVPDPNAPGGYKPFDQARSTDGLYPEYVRGGFSIFHCPSSKDTNKSVVMDSTGTPTSHKVYQYDSYDGFRNEMSGQYEQHYTLEWAHTLADVASVPAPANHNADDVDYERQLKFRNPPDDTIVTWCAWHEIHDNGTIRDKAIVVFLGGEAVMMDAAQVEQCKWRAKQE